MNPADRALVNKHLAAALNKVAAIQKNLAGAKASLEQQEKALLDTVKQSGVEQPQIQKPKSPSILDGDVDMSHLNAVLQKLSQGCDCTDTSTLKLPKQQ